MSRITLGRVATRPGDAAAGGGSEAAAAEDSLVFLNSVTATSASQISSGSFASLATAYIGIKIFVSGLKTATVSSIGYRTSSDGTNYADATFDYGAGDYGISATDTAEQVHQYPSQVAAGREVILTADSTASAFLATAAGKSLSAEITLFNLTVATATTIYPHSISEVVWEGVADVFSLYGYARRTDIVPHAGFLLVNRGGGVFIDGRMDIYGIRAA